MPKSWLESIPAWLHEASSYLPSMEDIKQASDNGVLSSLNVPGADVMGKAVGPILTGASQAARPIGAAGGVVGEQFAEANKSPELPLDESGNQIVPSLEEEIASNKAYDKRGYGMLDAAKEGAAMAPKTARESVNLLDVASLATGGLAGGLAKVAPAAARAAGIADLGLSAADATFGAGDVAGGYQEGDYGRMAQGAFRVGANAASGLSGLKTLRELGVKLPDQPRVDFEGPADWKPFNQRSITTAARNLETPEGNKFTFETRDPEMKMATKTRLEDPETYKNFSEMADFIHNVGKEATQDELHNNVATATSAKDPLAGILGEDVDMGAGDFRGFTESGNNPDSIEYGNRLHGLKDGTQPFFINPRNIAKRTSRDLEFLLEGAARPGDLERALAEVPPSVAEYVQSVRSGGSRTPELDNQAAGSLFARNVLYTSLHERLAHWSPEGGHGEGAPAYKDMAGSVDGQHTFEFMPRQVGIENEGMTRFEPANNAAITAIIDPGRLKALKAQMSTPEFSQKAAEWYRTSIDDKAISNKVAKRTDRVVGRAEAKAADKAFREEAPTPPGEVPPGSSGGEPQGPQLPSLASRIKQSLAANTKAINQNSMKMREVNNVRAQAMRDNEAKFAGQMISLEDFHKERGKILRGDYDLIKGLDPMVVTEAERFGMAQQIMKSSQDDAFRRNLAQAAFEKMTKGQRLEANEVQLVREVIGERMKVNEEDPAILKLGKFFANTTGSARAIMTAYDVSAAGRQALYAAVMNPGAVKESFKAQIQALKMTRPEFQSMMARLQDPMYNPFAEISKVAGLHFSESMDSAHPDKFEEAFYQGKWAEKLPGVRQSEQAYIAYLNKMRVELFNKHAKVMLDAGEEFVNPETGAASQKLQDLAYMVNTLTGRGELSLLHTSPNSPLGKRMGLTETLAPGKATADKMHSALTSVFFAPRFAASRAALMRDTVQAMVGGGLDPAISKIYMKNVFGTISAVTATMGALSAMGVGTFNTDPRKKDFGVLKVGNTRYDAYGGLKPWAKLASVIATDKYFSGRYSLPQKYGEKMGSKTKTGEIGRFVQGKLSPAAGFLLEGLTGEDFMGRKSSLMRNTYEHSFPMVIQTIAESVEANEADQLPLAVPLSMVGVGVNSYTDKRFKR